MFLSVIGAKKGMKIILLVLIISITTTFAETVDCRNEHQVETPIWYMPGAGFDNRPATTRGSGITYWGASPFRNCSVRQIGRSFHESLNREVVCYVHRMKSRYCPNDDNCEVPVYLYGHSRGALKLREVINEIGGFPNIKIYAFFLDAVSLTSRNIPIAEADNIQSYNFYQRSVQGSMFNRGISCDSFRGDRIIGAQNYDMSEAGVNHCNMVSRSLNHIDDILINESRDRGFLLPSCIGQQPQQRRRSRRRRSRRY